MCPVIFHIFSIPVYGFGLMMAIGFLVGSYIFINEFKRYKLDENTANNIALLAVVAGLVGSKILYLIENWSEFIAAPISMAFNPGGLTYYGGFLLATLSVYIYGNRKKIKFLFIADTISPSLMIGYGIARIGCHLAGDGDYGFPTNLPWGTDYSKGTLPPSVAFQDFPEITSKYPFGVVPDNTPCHPTPVYEFIICALLFWLLWKLRKRPMTQGSLFAIYLMLAGLERFVIEFMRINPRLLFGLSEAQIISAVLIIIGAIGYKYLNQNKTVEVQK